MTKTAIIALMLAIAGSIMFLPRFSLAEDGVWISNVRPSGAPALSVGNMTMIQWDSGGFSPFSSAGAQQKLKIFLKKNGYASCTIADNVNANLKSHSWQVGSCTNGKVEPASGYKLVVELKGTQIKGESAQAFELAQTPSNVTVIPAGLATATSVKPANKPLKTEQQKWGLAKPSPKMVALAPMIRTVSPSRVLPGTNITINGMHFTPAMGSKQLTMVDQSSKRLLLKVLRWTDTLIYAEVPYRVDFYGNRSTIYNLGIWDASAKISNTVPIEVQKPCMLSGVNPSSGVGGTQVALIGSNFGDQRFKALRFHKGLNEFSVNTISWSDNQIIVELPAGLTSGDYKFSVVRSSGEPLCGEVIFQVNAPLIRIIGPDSGQFLAGSRFSITGTGFGATSRGREIRISNNGSFTPYFWSDDGIMVQLDRPLSRGTHRVAIYEGSRRISNEKNITAVGPVGQ